MISANDNGGGGNHVLNIFNNTINEFQNKLCLIGSGPLANKADSQNISYINFQNKFFNRTLIEYINKEKFDIVNFHGARAVLLYIGIRSKLRCISVATVHSNFWFDFKNSKMKYYIYTPIYIYGLKKFHFFICLSNYIQDLLEKERIKGKKFIVGNGIDLRRINLTNSNDEVRKQLNISNNDFMFISVARFHPVKNHINIIRAFKLLSEDFKNVYMAFIGSGELEGIIKEEAVSLGISKKVKFLGYLKNPIDYLNSSDINMLVSLNEGGLPPLSVLEGYAVQKPAIISEFPGIRDIINNDCAFFVTPESVNSIYEAMKNSYINKEKLGIMGNEGLKLLKEKFTIHNFCSNYYDAYNMIIKEARGVISEEDKE